MNDTKYSSVEGPGHDLGVVVLAAGLGKRMHSTAPKVLHEVGGQPILFHILERIHEALPSASIALVVGYGREKVEEAVCSNPAFKKLSITFIHQPEPKGTGHAARCAMDSTWGQDILREKRKVLILPGDSPLLSEKLISEMAMSLGKDQALRLLTCELPDPTGYGRVVRKGKKGAVLRIVEQRDATAREKLIREVAVSIYLFNASFLSEGLHRLSNKNAQGEFYLTDLVAQAGKSKKKVDVLTWAAHDDLLGINDPWELAIVGRILNERTLRKWARLGVRFLNPADTLVETGVNLAEDVTIFPGVVLTGKTSIGKGTTVGPHVVLKDVQVGEGVRIKAGTVAEASVIEDQAQVGPYAHLRPESVVGTAVKIGNFVELKKSRVGSHTSVAHLSYLGDAEVGERVNIGCGFVTCNFDGRVIDGQRKHRTVIEDDVFLGSDCQVVAPIRIGKGAYIASGSTITENVEPESLAIARSRQVNKPGYAKKLKG